VTPVQLLCDRLTRSHWLQAYSVTFPSWKARLSSSDLLSAHAKMRGYVKDVGRPDESKSARIVLKDFVNGKLLYCNPPPDLSVDEKAEFGRSCERPIVRNAKKLKLKQIQEGRAMGVGIDGGLAEARERVIEMNIKALPPAVESEMPLLEEMVGLEAKMTRKQAQKQKKYQHRKFRTDLRKTEIAQEEVSVRVSIAHKKDVEKSRHGVAHHGGHRVDYTSQMTPPQAFYEQQIQNKLQRISQLKQIISSSAASTPAASTPSFAPVREPTSGLEIVPLSQEQGD